MYQVRENFFSMDKDKIIHIINNVHDTPNKDLIQAQSTLLNEFNETKKLILSLTDHLDSVIKTYDTINDEIGKRLGK